jgi:hypothetical protein
MGENSAERRSSDFTDTLVDEAGEESFPASDPPATWAGRESPVDSDETRSGPY